MYSRMIVRCLYTTLVTSLLACGDGTGPDPVPQSTTGNPPPVTQGAWYQPSVTTTWQWQLFGTVNTSYAVDLYDIDLFDNSAAQIAALQAAGRRVICYFSAGSYESFRPDTSLFPPAVRGKPLQGFPDEQWLDIRSPEVLAIMRTRMDLAVQKGCDGVEPDNVDGYVNDTGFPLNAADQLLFNRTIANEARNRGLAVGLKNDLGQIGELVLYFDFAVNEECHQFSECGNLSLFVASNKPVFNAEYDMRYVTDAAERSRVCAASRSERFHTLILPLGLDDAFRFSCEP